MKKEFYKNLKSKTLNDIATGKITYDKLDDILREDKEIVLEAIRHESFVYYDVPDILKDDREIVLASLKKYGLMLEFVSDKLKKDREIVFTAVKQCGFALKYADKIFKEDKEIVYEAIKSDGWALQFVGRKFFDIVLYLPLAIPTYIMAFTYADILSFTGPLQVFFRKNFDSISDFVNHDYMQVEILGLLMGLALYPYVYSVCRVSFSLIGSNYINLSKNLGLSMTKTFFKVILPLSSPAIISGLFLVIMEVLNEYGAVKYFGVNTYTSGIFRAYGSMGDVGAAIQLSVLLLFVVLLFMYIERKYHSRFKFYYSSNSKIQKLSILEKKNYLLSIVVCFVPFLLGFLIPFLFIVSNIFLTYNQIDFLDLIELTLNSVSVSTLASVIVVLVVLFFLIVEKFTKSSFNRYISEVISLGYAVPGAVIGLGLIILFTTIDRSQSSIVFYGSFFVLIYAYVVRFLAVGKSPIKSSLEKHPESYDQTAKNLGLGPFNLLKKIHIPINKFAIVTALIVTFIDLLKELPITLILRPFNFDTLATQTYEFAIEEMIPMSAAYSFIIIVIGSFLLIILKNSINKQINVS